jgi:hypothetical protein
LRPEGGFPATQHRPTATPLSSEILDRTEQESSLSAAIRQASNAFVTAIHLYKELAVSASDLLRPSTYLVLV